jgi:hypothetical protein
MINKKEQKQIIVSLFCKLQINIWLNKKIRGLSLSQHRIVEIEIDLLGSKII